MKKQLFFFLPLALMLAACSTAPVKVAPEQRSAIKRIGISVHVADQLTRQHVGITVFGNEAETLDIHDWNMDPVFEQQLAAAASKVLTAETIILSRPDSGLAVVNSLNGPYNAPAFWGPNFDAVKIGVQRSCREHALDGVLIAAKGKTGDFLGGTNQPLEGIGVYSRIKVYAAHALIKLAYIDCKVGSALAVSTVQKAALSNSWQSAADLRKRALTHNLSAKLAKKPLPKWTAEEKEVLKQTLTSLPEGSWETTLREMF
jgi:hypothetical protein